MYRTPSATPAAGVSRPGTRPLPFGVRMLLLGALLALSASCASAGQSSGAAQGSAGVGGSTGSGDSTASATSSGSAGPGRSTRPLPPAASASPSSPPTLCTPAPAVIAVHPGEPSATVCLKVGNTVTITAPPSAAQPWMPLTTSDAAVLACTSQRQDQGSFTATCRALAPGTATVTTQTAPFAGDPHGPPQYMWVLTIIVVRPGA